MATSDKIKYWVDLFKWDKYLRALKRRSFVLTVETKEKKQFTLILFDKVEFGMSDFFRLAQITPPFSCCFSFKQWIKFIYLTIYFRKLK